MNTWYVTVRNKRDAKKLSEMFANEFLQTRIQAIGTERVDHGNYGMMDLGRQMVFVYNPGMVQDGFEKICEEIYQRFQNTR